MTTAMMERPPGPPFGQQSQPPPAERFGLPGNPAQGRRAAVIAPAVSIPPPPPIPTIRNTPSNGSLTTSAPIASSQVIALARDAMNKALDENKSQAAEASGVSSELKPGVTVNLSHKNIQKLPDEVVDIIKDQLERLALSHNKLTAFPARFSECTSLRYLNVRNNRISDFPLSLCDLRSLEILDLGRNQLRVLPPEIVKLTSLKVFAVQKNQIRELPLCLADMVSLQMIKLEGNPIVFPPKEVLQVQANSPPNEGFLKESEVAEVTVTAHIKKFLRQRAQSDRIEADATGDESSEGTETPRMPPIKRVASGRFPIKVNVNGTELPDIRSPNLSRPPPIPTRSHYRGLSQQNPAQRRPSVMPLTIGNVNERVRSNSETLLQASRADRPGEQRRRLGIVSKKTQELGTLDETQANNRFSHYRGLSHGSAMQGSNGVSMATKSPASPAEPFLQRPIYVRRMSVLPERRRESKFYDPVLEAAKGILYSVFQIHPMIQMLMSLASDGTSKRSSLEIVFYNTNVHVEELEQEIQKHDPTVDGDELGQKENENVQRACITLVNAYAHVCSLLASNVDMFIDNGDPRYIRTLLMQLYNSIMELRVTATNPSPEAGYRRAASRAALGDTIRPHSRENSVTPTVERLNLNGRGRNGSVAHNHSNLRVTTDVPIPMAYIHGTGRTATITSATPRSGESFTSADGRAIPGEFTEEDRLFERIFLSLQKSSDQVMRTLPNFNSQFTMGMRNAMQWRVQPQVVQSWQALVAKCTAAIQQTEALKSRLSSIKLKEPGIRTQMSFWSLCTNFIISWVEFAHKIKNSMDTVELPLDTRARLRPIQITMKETMDLILSSPWSYHLRASNSGPFGGPGSNNSVQLPMTPQSAALGPAVQATVPSTPQSASFAGAFNGNVFERADALISMGGLHMPSRSGTFSTATGSSSLSSISSTLSSAQDGTMTPNSMLSPSGAIGPFPTRLNNGSKVAF